MGKQTKQELENTIRKTVATNQTFAHIVKDDKGRVIDIHEYEYFSNNALDELKEQAVLNKSLIAQEKESIAELLVAKEQEETKAKERRNLLLAFNLYRSDVLMGLLDDNEEIEQWYNDCSRSKEFAELLNNEVFNHYYSLVKGE